MKWICTATTAALIFISTWAGPAQAGDWYIGGTLHAATLGQWQRASYRNKLATAAIWALLQPDVRRISRKSSTMDTIKPYAIELVGCMDEIAVDINPGSDTPALAATCMAAMGW